MTRNEAYKTLKCYHCIFLDREGGFCLCGDPGSEDCSREESKDESIEPV